MYSYVAGCSANQLVLHRGSLLPDPRYDAVRAVVLAVMDDVEECPDGLYTARLMLFDDSGKPPKDAMSHVQVEICSQTPHAAVCMTSEMQ